MKTQSPTHLLLFAATALATIHLASAQIPLLHSATGYDTVRHAIDKQYDDNTYIYHEGYLSRTGYMDIHTKGFYTLQYVAQMNRRSDTLNLTVHVTDSAGCFIANQNASYITHMIGTSLDPSFVRYQNSCDSTFPVTTQNHVNTSQLGIYEVIHSVTDDKGITNKARKFVYVLNLAEPVLHIHFTKGTRFPLGTSISEMGIEAWVSEIIPPETAWVDMDTLNFQPDRAGDGYIPFRWVKRDLLGERKGMWLFRMITMGFPVGVGTISQSDVGLFPNPSHGVFHVELQWPIHAVRVYHVDGRMIHATYDEVTKQISVGEKGLFLIEIETTEGIFRKRVLVY